MPGRLDQLDSPLARLDHALAGLAASATMKPVIDRWRADAAALRFHLIPRDPNKPMLVAIIGGTGTGKSTLVNRLVGVEATATNFRRTFTAGSVAIGAMPATCRAVGLACRMSSSGRKNCQRAAKAARSRSCRDHRSGCWWGRKVCCRRSCWSIPPIWMATRQSIMPRPIARFGRRSAGFPGDSREVSDDGIAAVLSPVGAIWHSDPFRDEQVRGTDRRRGLPIGVAGIAGRKDCRGTKRDGVQFRRVCAESFCHCPR